jgi:diacylglycerol kinase (ATP)
MAVEENRWGIIYCPKAGSHHTHKRWEEINSYLEQKGVVFDFVQSESVKSVERLTSMLVQNGYRTIVVVGGDSALNDALNGVMNTAREHLSDIALGVLPNGLANDFAKFWGLDEGDYRKAIDLLRQRRLRKVDVGTCSFTLDGKAVTRYFLNCANVGVVASIMNIKYMTRRFWGLRTLSMLASMFLLLFQRLEFKVHLRVNEDEVNRHVMNVCVGNARSYGMTPSAVPYSGTLDVSIVSQPEITQLVHGLWLLFSGRFLNYKKLYPYRTRQVHIEQAGKACISLDGRVLTHYAMPMDIGIRSEALNFIIGE